MITKPSDIITDEKRIVNLRVYDLTMRILPKTRAKIDPNT